MQRPNHAELAEKIIKEGLDGYEHPLLDPQAIEAQEHEHLQELVEHGYYTQEEADALFYKWFNGGFSFGGKVAVDGAQAAPEPL